MLSPENFAKETAATSAKPGARESQPFLWIMAVAGLLILLATAVASAQEQRSAGRRGAGVAEPRWVTPARERFNGTHYKTFHSRTINGSVSYLIYLPPEYEQETEKRYPVLYWLHGGGGRLESGGAFIDILDSAIREGQAPPVIAVLVNGLQSMYNDSLDGKQPVESVITKDLIPHVDETYRTVAARAGRWIEGFSMGGYGAVHLGFKYPELFGAVSNLAGALVNWNFFTRRAERHANAAEGRKKGGQDVAYKIFGGNKEYFEANHPLTLAKNNADAIRGNTLIRIVVGDLDRGRGTLQANQDLHELLRSLQIAHEFITVPGVKHSYQKIYEVLGNDRGFDFFNKAFARLNRDSPRP